MGFSRLTRSLVFLNTVILLSLAAPASAQTTTPPLLQSSIMRDLLDQDTGKQFGKGSPANREDEYAGFDKVQGSENIVEPVNDYTCPQGPGQCNGNPVSSGYVEGNEQEYPLAATVPPVFNATTDLLWSPTQTLLLKNQMASATIVQAAAIALTEPAVMAAIDYSMRTAQTHHTNSLLTGVHAGTIGSTNPASREFQQVYLHCMQDVFQEEGLGFAEAQARCLRDTGNQSNKFLKQGFTLNPIEPSMNFGHTPALQVAQVGAALTNIQNGRLSELLFNEQIYTSVAPQQVTHQSIDNAKRDFQRFYGDVQYTIDFDTTTQRLKAEHEVLEPVWLPNDHMELRVHERWENMRIVLWSYCDWLKDHQTTASVNNGSTTTLPINVWGDLYDSSGGYAINPVILRNLSVPGYDFSAQEFDLLFREIENEPRFKKNCNKYFGDNATVLAYCPFTTYAGGPICVTPSSPVTMLLRSPYTSNNMPIRRFITNRILPDFGRTVPRLFKKMHFLARFLSRMEILQEALIMQGLLGRISFGEDGAISGSLMRDAQKLILKAASTDNPAEDLKKAQTTLLEYIEDLKREMDRDGASAVQAVGQIPNNQ